MMYFDIIANKAQLAVSCWAIGSTVTARLHGVKHFRLENLRSARCSPSVFF